MKKPDKILAPDKQSKSPNPQVEYGKDIKQAPGEAMKEMLEKENIYSKEFDGFRIKKSI